MLIVSADEEPNDFRFIQTTYRAIVYADPNGIQVLGSGKFLEIKTLVGWVFFEGAVGAFGLLPSFAANRACQSFSDSMEARICAAIASCSSSGRPCAFSNAFSNRAVML